MSPFRTLGNDDDGRAYAEAEGLDFPFPNDYFDAPDGSTHELEPDEDTVCSGIILVGYQEPLEDHMVSCATLVDVASQGAVPVAIWRAGQRVIQVSELYRP